MALIAAGLLALVLQGALATLLVPPWCPDLVLLVLIAIALRWEGVEVNHGPTVVRTH